MRNGEKVASVEELAEISVLLEAARFKWGAAHTERLREAFLGPPTQENVTDEGPQRANFIIPGLLAKPWHDASTVALATELEALWPSLDDETDAIIGATSRYAPYQQDRSEFVDTRSWHTLDLLMWGLRFDENCKLAPRTVAAVKASDSHAEVLTVSALQPGGHILPHCGPWNTRLTIHLGLSIPRRDCWLGVGGEAREWTTGRCLVFDDSFMHEAVNGSDVPRIVLLLDVWHPDLTLPEVYTLREIVGVLSRSQRARLNAASLQREEIVSER